MTAVASTLGVWSNRGASYGVEYGKPSAYGYNGESHQNAKSSNADGRTPGNTGYESGYTVPYRRTALWTNMLGSQYDGVTIPGQTAYPIFASPHNLIPYSRAVHPVAYWPTTDDGGATTTISLYSTNGFNSLNPARISSYATYSITMSTSSGGFAMIRLHSNANIQAEGGKTYRFDVDVSATSGFPSIAYRTLIRQYDSSGVFLGQINSVDGTTLGSFTRVTHVFNTLPQTASIQLNLVVVPGAGAPYTGYFAVATPTFVQGDAELSYVDTVGAPEYGLNTFYQPATAVGPATLSPSLVTNTNTLYSPTVTQPASGQNLTQSSTASNSQTFYAPSISLTLTQSTPFDGSQTFYSPTVAPGAVTLTPALFTSATGSFFTPTVTRGAVSLSPSLYTNSNTIYAASISFTLTQSSRYDNSQTFYAPAVTAGPVNLAPSLYSNSQTFYSATVALNGGPQTLTPARYDNSQTFYAAVVSVGAVNLTPSLYSNTSTFYAPVVSVGAVSLLPSLYTNTQTFYAATVSAGGTALTQSARLDNSSTIYAPVVAAGAVTLTPSLVTNSNTFFAAVLTPPPQTLTQASQVTNTSSFFVATVGRGTVTLTPLRVDGSQSFYVPVVSPGAVTVLPGLFTNTSSVFVPTVDLEQSYVITYAQAQALYRIYLLHGLKAGSPLTVSQTQRIAGGVTQAINESGGSVTIHTTAVPTTVGADPGTVIDELAALHGLTADLIVSDGSRTFGSASQSIASDGSTTTVTRQ